MRRALAGTLALLAGWTAAQAGDFSRKALGTTGAQFLELAVSARAVGMGSAQDAVAGDASALYHNPAGLAAIDRGSLVLSHAAYVQSVSYQYGAAAYRLRFGTLGFGIQSLSPGSLDEVDNTGAITGNSFRPHDEAVSVGYGGSWGVLDAGIGLKYISSQIRDAASTVAADLGSRLRAGKWTFSASMAHLGQGLKFQSQRDRLPTTARLGSGWQAGRWLLALDGVAPRGADPFMAAGMEYGLPLSERFGVAGRWGYNSRLASSRLGGGAGLGMGLGVTAGRLKVDYAWSPHGDFEDDAHRLSLGFSWGDGV
jgi:hypothetical protein